MDFKKSTRTSDSDVIARATIEELTTAQNDQLHLKPAKKEGKYYFVCGKDVNGNDQTFYCSDKVSEALLARKKDPSVELPKIEVVECVVRNPPVTGEVVLDKDGNPVTMFRIQVVGERPDIMVL